MLARHPRLRVAAAFAGRLRHHPAGLLTGAGVAFGVHWFSPPGSPVAVGAAVALAAGFALSRPRASSVAAALAFATYALLENVAPDLPASYESRLRFEALIALLPAAGFALLAVAAKRSGVRAPGRSLAWLAVALAFAGSAFRVGEVLILFDRPGDSHTIDFVLRFDGAYALWGAAAGALAAAFASGVLLTVLGRRGRRAERVALGAALVAFLLFVMDVSALAVAVASPPPQMAVGYHADHLEDVPEGADLVHLEADWARIERAEGDRKWEGFDRQLDAAAERGLSVYLLVSTYPPRWLIEKHPESVMQDASGDPFTWLDEAPGAPRHRVWDLSFADERVVAAKRDFVAAAVARYGDHPAVRYVAVANEPAYPFDYNLLRWGSFDPHTLDAFRHALADEHVGNLEALNEEYGTEFESWADVTPPRLPFGDLGDRWMRFREDLLIEYVEGLVATAKPLTDRPVTVKIMSHALTRFGEPQAGLSDRVYRAFADASEVVSVDLYPATEADLVRSVRYFKEIARGKPLVVAEFNLALGSRLPGSGARMLSALDTMEDDVEAVILFSASGHHLYGMGPGSLAVAGVQLFHSRPGDPDYVPALRSLVVGEVRTLLALPEDAFRAARMLVVALR